MNGRVRKERQQHLQLTETVFAEELRLRLEGDKGSKQGCFHLILIWKTCVQMARNNAAGEGEINEAEEKTEDPAVVRKRRTQSTFGGNVFAKRTDVTGTPTYART